MEITLSYLQSAVSYLQTGFSAVAPFVVLLGLLIFVHELGHFLVARMCGVRVEIFSLGFGKKILSYKKGDTTYCLSLIPLGGYVKMFGDEMGAEIPESEKKFSFTHKSVSRRIAVVLAGPVMNFLFALLVFAVVSLLGEEVRAPLAGDINADSTAYQAGFRSGDQILGVEGESVKTWDDFQHLLNQANDRSVRIEVKRESSEQTLNIEAKPKLSPNPNVLSLESMVGEIDGLSASSRAPAIAVRPGLPAYKAGFRVGDFIKSINGKPIKYFRDIENALLAYQGHQFNVEIERFTNLDFKNAQNLTIAVPAISFSSLAVFGFEAPDLYLAKVMEKTPAIKAGLKDGDRIVEVNGKVPTKWEDVLSSVKGYSGVGAISIKVEREGTVQAFEVTPQMSAHMNTQGGEEKRYTIGIIPYVSMAPPAIVTLRSTGLISGFSRGLEKSCQVTVMTVVSFLRLIQGIISPKNIGGVISIGQAASETFKIGISHFLSMMGIISINLFILNLLPIPVLDGGHLLFYTIEALRGAPMSIRKMEIAQQVGLAVLMSLMVFALFNDFSRLFSSL